MKVTGESFVIHRTIDLGNGLSVTFVGGPDGVDVEWRPRLPDPGSLTARQIHTYRTERNKILREVAVHRGGEQSLEI